MLIQGAQLAPDGMADTANRAWCTVISSMLSIQRHSPARDVPLSSQSADPNNPGIIKYRRLYAVPIAEDWYMKSGHEGAGVIMW